MKVKIVDENHIKLIASDAEISEFSNHIGILIDNKDTFVCNSEPSSSAFEIVRPLGGSIFNIPLDISDSAFTTNELLIIFLKLDDLTYPVIIPCYNNNELINSVAYNSGILDIDKITCVKDVTKAEHIVFYYAFKLALSILDIRSAIKFYNKIYNDVKPISECNCND